MKSILSLAALAVTALVIASSSAQTPAGKDEQDLLALTQDVQNQQAAIADNAAKIDAKMAEVMEAVRVARLYAGRGGK
jgi:hypothetical protein